MKFSIKHMFTNFVARNKPKRVYMNINHCDDCNVDEIENASTVEQKRIDKELKLLVFSDLQGSTPEIVNKIKDINNYSFDIVLLLGDMRYDLLNLIRQNIKGNIYGILGNHDKRDLYERYNIINIHQKIIEIDGLKITGFEGSIKYKDADFPSFTQEESVEEAFKLEDADILISHSAPYGIYENSYSDDVHVGLQGISEYINSNKVSLDLHGHNHKDTYTILNNGTTVIGIYGASIVNIKTLEVNKIF